MKTATVVGVGTWLLLSLTGGALLPGASAVLPGTRVSAQSLGDVARQEEARRKAIRTPAKVYTNESLRADPLSLPPAAAQAPAPPGSTPAPAATAVPPAGAAAVPGTPVAPEPSGAAQNGAGLDEAAWRKRIADARDGQARSQTFVEALQSRINALSADFVNRDDPAQRAQIGLDRQKALAELDRVRADIVKFQKDISDAQEEARRAGVPAGWVR